MSTSPLLQHCSRGHSSGGWACCSVVPDSAFIPTKSRGSRRRGGGGAVNRELKKLTATGQVTVNRRGNQTRYQANPDSLVFAELRALVVKTMGIADQLRQALSPFAEQISFAFISGSVARGTEGAGSVSIRRW